MLLSAGDPDDYLVSDAVLNFEHPAVATLAWTLRRDNPGRTALLRVQGIPAGLCYQRLSADGTTFVLHGLMVVHLDGAWHRQDPRGNKCGIDAQFSLSEERLAWPVRPELGECDYPEVYVRPHPVVVTALAEATNILDLCDAGLPASL